MYNFEFEKVMKVMGLSPVGEIEGVDLKKHDLYKYCGLNVSFGGSNYAVVDGKIPLEVVKTIYKKYPENQYKIRINGGREDYDPDDWARDDAFDKEIREINDQYDFSHDEWKSLVNQAKEKLKKRKTKGKYITSYHIDTKEGLLIFLTEMQDYCLKHIQREETEVKKYNKYLAAVTSSMLEDINPSISASEWMQGDDENRDFYNKTIERDYSNVLTASFRNSIIEFDKAVNPFLDDTIRMDDASNFIDKVKISGTLSDQKGDVHRDNCCDLSIVELDAGNNTTSYYRDPNGFSFEVTYGTDKNCFISIRHAFSMSNVKEEDRGEKLVIKTYGDYCEEPIDVEFNITNGTIGRKYGEKRPATIPEISYIYEQLQNAIDYASSVTLDNMRLKQENELTLNNLRLKQGESTAKNTK